MPDEGVKMPALPEATTVSLTDIFLIVDPEDTTYPGGTSKRAPLSKIKTALAIPADLSAEVDAIGADVDALKLAPPAHTHAIGNVTGLQAALDGKAPTAHAHTPAEVTGFEDAVETKVVGLLVEGTGITLNYDGGGSLVISASGGGTLPHTHAIADVTGLQGALDSKAPTAHTHAAADITSGVIAPARLGTGTPDGTTALHGDGTWKVPAGGGGGGVTDHGALTGLADDDHSQYALLAGRSGGQIITGGTDSGDDITIRSTSNATKGDVFIGSTGTKFDPEGRLTIGLDSTNGQGIKIAAATANFVGFTVGRGNGVQDGTFEYYVPTGSFMIGSPGAVTIRSTEFSWQRLAGPNEECFKLNTNGDVVLAKNTTVQLRDIATFVRDRVDNTDATYKGRLTTNLRDYNAARVVKQEWADGTYGRMSISAPNAAPVDAQIGNGQISFYLDQTANNLVVRVKYSDGTLKTATLPLTS